MHMADALLSPFVAATMYACSTVAAGHSVRRVKLVEDREKVPVMGVMGAFVFGAQMINFTIPGTGSSGHLCGGMLLSAVLGPEAGFLTMIGILLIQCLVFADGGLLALGANVWNMAFYGCFIGGFLIWRGMMKRGVSKKRIFAASILGCILTLQLGAFSVVLETTASGITELPFGVFAGVMQPIHLAIGLVEGLITAAVLVFLYEVRPELLWGTGETEREARWPAKTVVLSLAGITVVVAGFVSLFASAFPDGLEWSVERVTGVTELERTGGVYSLAERLQTATAVLPDYSVQGMNAAGTSISGIVGGAIVVLLCLLFCGALKWVRKQRRNE
ncbi:MAG: energy-coupling factor ABC transporter permease [Muribaculaceae bacterium]|nr:energy-coupling factor ABC transporter permease [Roseburia sp.]MCM1430895.1 energy-coupling factor ABC transporter permease [Muribaculaceae bacterium]MCM1491744.1 energy-coupling factor ABC transporter permease [Muribaculaceae bacterium]